MEKRLTVSKSDGDKDVRITVEEIENGYLITRNKDWKDGDEWKYETKKYYSKENPLPDNDDDGKADAETDLLGLAKFF